MRFLDSDGENKFQGYLGVDFFYGVFVVNGAVFFVIFGNLVFLENNLKLWKIETKIFDYEVIK